MRIVARNNLHWEDLKLCWKDEVWTELIPHEIHLNHYHLKFRWRDEKTPEFFNIVNARENARVYSRRKIEESLSVPSLVSLND